MQAPEVITDPQRSRLSSWATLTCSGSHLLSFGHNPCCTALCLFPKQRFLLYLLQDICIPRVAFSWTSRCCFLLGTCLSEALLMPEELVPILEQLVNTSTVNSVNASADRLRCLLHQEDFQKAALLCGQLHPGAAGHSANLKSLPACTRPV